MKLSDQGGGCCGRKIISGFGSPHWKPSATKAKADCPCPSCERIRAAPPAEEPKSDAEKLTDIMVGLRKIAQGFREAGQEVIKSKAVEAVLTDNQLIQHEGYWPNRLKEEGFRFIGRFNNNSGSICNIFMWSESWIDGSPPGWED
jgi:hypothetical protein